MIFPFFYFNTTVSGVCKSLRVQLKNNAWEAQTNKEGTYELASKVNEQPSWISEYAGIWYVPETTRWMIGPLEFIGSDAGGIESKELGSKVEPPYNILVWNYHTENGWVPYNGNDDVIVGCVSHSKTHKKKDKPILLFLTLFLMFFFDPIFDVILTLVLSSCVGFCLLAHLTQDLYQSL
jgi:hypothetical protein